MAIPDNIPKSIETPSTTSDPLKLLAVVPTPISAEEMATSNTSNMHVLAQRIIPT